jgi:macrolide transport system ATP-binding/permease protein
MESVFQDIRYGIRNLLKHPGFAAIAIITLALGIGINSALFTIFNAFALKPLPVKEPWSLVNFNGADAAGNRQRLFSYLDYLDYRNQKNVLSDVIAWNKVSATLGEAPPNDADDFTLAEGYEHLFGQIVSANYFTALGAEMELGRGFSSFEDQRQEESSVVVLGHAFWQRRFLADRSVIGKTIVLQGQPFTIIGVAQRDFIGTTPDVPSFWAPLMARDRLIRAGGWGHQRWLTDRDAEVFTLIGRMATGVTRRQAEAALQLTTSQLVQSYPSTGRKTVLKLENGSTFVSLDEDVMPLITPLFLGFGLVLLIACANVANLNLAHAAVRQREIGVRLALGAGRVRVVRQLITESMLLALAGGVAGLLVAVWALSALYPLVLSSLPLPQDLSGGFALNLNPDWRIFFFTFAVAAAAGVVAGLAPALQASSTNLVTALKDEGSTIGGRLSRSRLRNVLVVAQIATCCALLAAAALLVKSSRRVQNADTGMTTKNVFSIAVGLSESSNERPATTLEANLRQELAEQLQAVPGVLSVSRAYRQPLSGQMGNTLVSLPTEARVQLREARFNLVSAAYFQTLSIPILRGRGFTRQEVDSKSPVLVVSEATARRYWPGVEAIGQQIGVAIHSENVGSETSAEQTKVPMQQYEVIGIARDTRSRWVWQKDETLLYVPLRQADTAAQYLLVQTQNDPAQLMSGIRTMAANLHPQLRTSVRRLDEGLAYQTAPFRAVAWISAVLGILALLLASVGLYGVMSFTVASRTREIGVRVALGANPRDVVRMFILQGLWLTCIGMVCGLAGGAVISRLLASILIDLSPVDPVAFSAVSIFLTLVALLAILIPAQRAAKVDPLVALRYE